MERLYEVIDKLIHQRGPISGGGTDEHPAFSQLNQTNRFLQHFIICSHIFARLLDAGMVHKGLEANNINACADTVCGEATPTTMAGRTLIASLAVQAEHFVGQ